ncbi:hypothetical protein [Desertihabitans brevis]|uniref:hypothetical protein n=1 Tax=Desertihabitans brevis TaxID=2268447 RepID=UPI0018F57722|nr:hypothetical protein [Desertihabitans brevis]
MNRPIAAACCAAGCLVAVLAGTLGAAAGPAAAHQPTPEPPGDTVVRVTGDAANGFSILHADGTELHPPTDSEALAECAEYDTARQRVACRTEVRTWYRDLAVLQQALEWAGR